MFAGGGVGQLVRGTIGPSSAATDELVTLLEATGMLEDDTATLDERMLVL